MNDPSQNGHSEVSAGRPAQASSKGYAAYGYPGYGYPGTAAASTASTWTRYYRFLKMLWWIPVLTVAIGLVLSAANTLFEPTAYMSSARMWVSGKMQLKENNYYSEELQFFFGTQVELLQSDKIRAGAAARVQAVNPNLKVCPVSIQAVQAPKSAMFLLHATGDDPEYTRTYLNALIDEYLNYKKQVRATSSDDTLNSLSEQVFAHEKELKAEQEKLSKYQEGNNLAVLQDQSSAAGSYLAKLTTQLSDLKLEEQFLQAMALDSSTNAAGTNLLSTANSSVLSGQTTLPAANASPELVGARQQLQLLRLQRDELAQSLRPKHPKMQRLEEDIARGEKLLTLYRQQSVDQMREQFEPARQALKIKMDAVQEQIKDWEGKLTDANQRIAEFDRLKANVARVQGIYEKLVGLLQSVDMNKALDQEIVSVMERASPPRPTKRPAGKSLATAGVGGLFAGLALIFAVARFDDRFTTLNELMAQFEEEIVGQVPDVRKTRRKGKLQLLEVDDERHMFAESYRNIRSSVLFMPAEGQRPKVILITSAVPNEGKSTVSANLAATMAFGGSRTLLIDGDMRKGKLRDHFGLEPGKGLSELLDGTDPFDDFIQATEISKLAFLPSGELVSNAGELYLSDRFEQLLAHVRDRFDQVIIDTPPVFAADDAPTIATKMDGVLYVVRGSFTKVKMARQALEILYQRQAKVLGLILNRADINHSTYYYYKYAEYYSGGKKSSKSSRTTKPGKSAETAAPVKA